MSSAPIIFIDGDFPTDTPCSFHCSPTCHPAQVGPVWLYGCTHWVWPQNRAGDFVPIVNCDGIPGRCEIPKKVISRAIDGQKRRLSNALQKAHVARDELRVLRGLQGSAGG